MLYSLDSIGYVDTKKIYNYKNIHILYVQTGPKFKHNQTVKLNHLVLTNTSQP